MQRACPAESTCGIRRAHPTAGTCGTLVLHPVDSTYVMAVWILVLSSPEAKKPRGGGRGLRGHCDIPPAAHARARAERGRAASTTDGSPRSLEARRRSSEKRAEWSGAGIHDTMMSSLSIGGMTPAASASTMAMPPSETLTRLFNELKSRDKGARNKAGKELGNYVVYLSLIHI